MSFRMASACRLLPPRTTRSGRMKSSTAEPSRRNSGLETTSKDRKSTRLNSSHDQISYAVFCLKKKKTDFFVINLMHPALKRLQADYETMNTITPSLVYVRASVCDPNCPRAALVSTYLAGQHPG